uniref:Integrin, alpha E, tandem duplicate 2 n=1 Tax=Astyanax mexicanus TaxID=7994 RepID=W5K3A7_ASTMX
MKYQSLQLDYLSKMFAAFLLVTGLCTTAAFNIFTTQVETFTNIDPRFGQTIVKSRDGVYVPTKGKVFKCVQDSECVLVNEIEMKGLKPIVSVSSNLTEEEEQFLVCNQVRTRNGSAEYFNGLCVHMINEDKQADINPSKLVSQQQQKNALKGASENKTGHSRRKRQAELNGDDEEEDEEEDAGTEIAFVLDGSGSIEPEDFVRAKDFMSDVMKNVWTTCLTCNFAIVQFGSEIRTELSLMDNDDGEKALDKVKNINQIGKLTKTASALYHVLTEVFVPEHGSKPNATKMIIVLSDGEMKGIQPRNLSYVLEMPQMKGVLRYSIGVGSELLNSKKAINEMTEIAGSKDRFFKVSDYAALNTILSKIEKSIFDIEGINKGAGFHFELAEAGFSSHLTHEGSMLFGAVGAYDWSGGIILKGKEEESVTFFNATTEEPRFSYLGYSVTSGRMGNENLYISGAPRYNLTGAVFIFNGTDQELILGDQVGSYFGSVLCALDIDSDQETDYLLVGAPHFHIKGEEGKVFVYKLHEGKFQREDYVLQGTGKHIYARFGSAIVDIGDIDGNKFRDVAVGAPLEPADELTDVSGAIYIYNGFEYGIKQQFSQRIAASGFEMKLVHFGQAVSAMMKKEDSERDKNNLLLSVGSQGAVTVLKTVPVIIITPKITLGLTEISPDKQNNEKSSQIESFIQICFDNTRKRIDNDEELLIEYQIDLDFGKEEKRLIFVEHHEKQTRFTLTKYKNCISKINVKYMGCYDCFSPIKIKVQFELPSHTEGIPVRVLDAFSPTEFTKEIEFQKECNITTSCKPKFSLDGSKLSNYLIIIGSSQSLGIIFDLQNSGKSSYITTLTLTYPNILQAKKIEGGSCEMKNEDLQIICKLLHPVFKGGAQTKVAIDWQPINSRKSDLTTGTIRAVLTGGNAGTKTLASKEYDFVVRNALKLQLTGTASQNIFAIEEGKESPNKDPKVLQFTFKLLGDNKYKAEIHVMITIEKKTQDIKLIIKQVRPQEHCKTLSGEQNESNLRVECILTELQDITINTDVIINDIKITERITAKAELSFNESIYEGQDMRKMEKVEVVVIKQKIVKSTAVIAGGSVGGFLLLIIIIIVLIKCGFFRRRHHMERTQSTH